MGKSDISRPFSCHLWLRHKHQARSATFGLSAWFCQGTFFQHLIGLWLSPTITNNLVEVNTRNTVQIKTRTLHGSFLQMAWHGDSLKPLEHFGRPVESTPPFPSICHHPALQPAGWEPQGAQSRLRSQWRKILGPLGPFKYGYGCKVSSYYQKIGSMLKNLLI